MGIGVATSENIYNVDPSVPRIKDRFLISKVCSVVVTSVVNHFATKFVFYNNALLSLLA